MKFQVRLVHKVDPTKTLEEEIAGANDAEINALYAMMYPDFNVQILNRMGDPTVSKMPVTKNEQQPQPQNKPKKEEPPPPPKEVLFEDNGIEYKVVDNVIYKKSWVAVDPVNFRIINGKTMKIVNDEKFLIQTQDWVNVMNSPKDEIIVKD